MGELNKLPVRPGFDNIPSGALERADDLSHLLVGYYGEGYAVQVATQALAAIGCKRQAEQLLEVARERESQKAETEGRPLGDASGGMNAFQEVLFKLHLHMVKKLTLQQVLEISSKSLEDCTPHSPADLPWHFLRKVLALNVTARDTRLYQQALEDQGRRGKEDEARVAALLATQNVSVNPLDVLCAVLLCSDSFLQQEILLKMSMCQFALPLLLPPIETPNCTFLLWGMRDIVKKWMLPSLAASRGFQEESLVLASMPTISFVRMGRCSLSKSKLLNEFLSPSQQYCDFFIHGGMECGNLPRAISNGLVEIAWHFPGGQGNTDVFPEPFAAVNLHGDVESHWVQFNFLTQVSSAVFIFAESISEAGHDLLSSLKESSTQYYFILEAWSGIFKEMWNALKKFTLALRNLRIIVIADKTNKAEFVNSLRSTVRGIINSHPKTLSLSEMAAVARELAIQVDEDSQECQNALRCAVGITGDIQNVARYKADLAKTARGLSKMESREARHSKKDSSALKGLLQESRYEPTAGLTKFVNGIKDLKLPEKHYFLKWLKFNLGCIARRDLAKLRAVEHKEKALGARRGLITEVDQRLSSLGVQHFVHALRQCYEAESKRSRLKMDRVSETQRMFPCFPSIAADLMLEGFPLELVDGDTFSIPLRWITDVLNELHEKLGGRSKMMVITVLGLQRTGKSTLLNTMFGLQFTVSNGQCTRGAFMTLLRVTGNLQAETGCDFILVIDTEGLKAHEQDHWTSRQDHWTSRHDHRLAALAIGLSDIILINLAGENATKRKNLLRIVTCALFWMHCPGQQKRSCQFVHQNVSDVSAHDQSKSDRKHLLEQQLNEMTQVAAAMENIGKEITFSDIVDYDPEMHNWYIPDLWLGAPPMAPVNIGYSEKVFELKKSLLDFIRNNKTRKDIPWFTRTLRQAIRQQNLSCLRSWQKPSLMADYGTLSVNTVSRHQSSAGRESNLPLLTKHTFVSSAEPEGKGDGPVEECVNEDLSEPFRLEVVYSPQWSQRTYKLRFTRAGSFCCCYTNLRFDAKAAVSITYQLDSWQKYQNECREEQFMIAGPLFSIQADPAEAVAAVYFPHFLYLEEKDSSQVQIAHFVEGKVSLEKPDRVERSCAVLKNPSFSPRGVVFKKSLFKKKIKVHAVALLYRVLGLSTPKFHLYLLPNDISLRKVVDEYERECPSLRVLKPPETHKPLTIGSSFIVKRVHGVTISPKKLTFKYLDATMEQPYLELYAEKMQDPLELHVMETFKDELVWEAYVRQEELKSLDAAHLIKGLHLSDSSEPHFIECHRDQLIQRTTDVNGVLDLLHGNLLNEEQYRRVISKATNPDKMRELYSLMPGWSCSGKAKFYEALRAKNSLLIEDLEDEGVM